MWTPEAPLVMRPLLVSITNSRVRYSPGGAETRRRAVNPWNLPSPSMLPGIRRFRAFDNCAEEH